MRLAAIPRSVGLHDPPVPRVKRYERGGGQTQGSHHDGPKHALTDPLIGAGARGALHARADP